MTTPHKHARKTVTPEFQEAENKLQRCIDHYIDPQAKDDPEARAIMREWVVAHVNRGAIDIRDF